LVLAYRGLMVFGVYQHEIAHFHDKQRFNALYRSMGISGYL